MIISVRLLWWLTFRQLLFLHLFEALKINTGVKHACSSLKLQCSKNERIWMRRAILIFSNFSKKSTLSTPSQSSLSSPTFLLSNCSINFASLSWYPHCDITNAVVQRCSHSLYCQISLSNYKNFCSLPSDWKEIGVVVDNFICLPKTTKSNQYYQTMEITSEYFRDTNITSQYFYLSTPNYPDLWWFPKGNVNQLNLKYSSTFQYLKICAVKFKRDKINVYIIDFKVKGQQKSVNNSSKTGIKEIDSMLDECPLIIAPLGGSEDVVCVNYLTSNSYSFRKPPSHQQSYILVVFNPTSYTKLNLFIDVFKDLEAGLECNTPTVTQLSLITKPTITQFNQPKSTYETFTVTTTKPKLEIQLTMKNSSTTTVAIQVKTTNTNPLQTDKTEQIIIGASVAAAVVLLACVALVACVSLHRKKRYKHKKAEKTYNKNISMTNSSPTNVHRNTTFLQAFKPLNIPTKVYDRIRNLKNTNTASYYYGDNSQTIKKDKSSNDTKESHSNEAKNNKIESYQNQTSDAHLTQPEKAVFAKACKIPTLPNNTSKPPSSPSIFPESNEPIELITENNHAASFDQIKSKLQMLHQNRSVVHSSSSSQSYNKFLSSSNSIVLDEDIYVNASEI